METNFCYRPYYHWFDVLLDTNDKRMGPECNLSQGMLFFSSYISMYKTIYERQNIRDKLYVRAALSKNFHETYLRCFFIKNSKSGPTEVQQIRSYLYIGRHTKRIFCDTYKRCPPTSVPRYITKQDVSTSDPKPVHDITKHIEDIPLNKQLFSEKFPEYEIGGRIPNKLDLATIKRIWAMCQSQFNDQEAVGKCYLQNHNMGETVYVNISKLNHDHVSGWVLGMILDKHTDKNGAWSYLVEFPPHSEDMGLEQDWFSHSDIRDKNVPAGYLHDEESINKTKKRKKAQKLEPERVLYSKASTVTRKTLRRSNGHVHCQSTIMYGLILRNKELQCDMVLRQVVFVRNPTWTLNNPGDGHFVYYFRSKKSMRTISEFEMSDLLSRETGHYELMDGRISSSGWSSLVFCLPTKHQSSKRFAPMPRSIYQLGTRHVLNEKEEFLERGLKRNALTKDVRVWRKSQQDYLDSIHDVVQKYCKDNKCTPARLRWKTWRERKDPNYNFQVSHILICSSGENDEILEKSVDIIYRETTPERGLLFDCPYAFAKYPKQLYLKMTRNIRRPPKSHVGIIESDPKTDRTKNTLDKCLNYCCNKAVHSILFSKRLLISNLPKGLRESATKEYLDIRKHSSKLQMALIPMDMEFLKHLSPTTNMFPKEYNAAFLDSFLNVGVGVGLKVRHLMAAALYDIMSGPPVDIHMLRFAVCHGTASPLFNQAEICEHIAATYRKDQYETINEVCGAVAQLLRIRGHDSLQKKLLKTAVKFDMKDEMESFLFQYPKQNK